MKSLEENAYWIWISQMKNIKNCEIKMLLQTYKIEKLFNIQRLSLINEISQYLKSKIPSDRIQIIIKELTNGTYKKDIKTYIQKCKRQSIEIITYEDEEYPINLRFIYDSPLYLFYKGNISLINNYKKISIVGSRNYSLYGKSIALDFSYKLALKGLLVISGGARGIDTFSHIGALQANKPTVAILGNGIDYIYPLENKQLEKDIIKKGGLLISEYLVGTPPNKLNFPQRNRILSGISDGLLIVEACKNSGALITTDFALEQGKTIFAIPGNINSKNSEGTNNLIKQGANIVNDINDILSYY